MIVKSIMATVLAVAAGGVGLGVSGKFCDDDCGHGGDEAKVTQSDSSKASLVSFSDEGHEGKCQGKCHKGEGHGANKDKVTKAASSKTSLVSLTGEGHEGECKGKCEGGESCDDGCGHGGEKAKPAADTEANATQGTLCVAKVN